MVKAETTLAPEGILALCQRLRAHAYKAGPFAADMRLAWRLLTRLAALALVDTAHTESDPQRRRQLEQEARRAVGAMPWRPPMTTCGLCVALASVALVV